jgi:TolB protein
VTFSNDTEPLILLINPPLADSVITESGLISLEGVARGRDFSKFIIQMQRTDTGDNSADWIGIDPVDATADQHVCAQETRQSNTSFVSTQGVLGVLDPEKLEDGVYQMRLTLCTDDGAEADEQLITNITINVRPLPFLRITSPTSDALITSDINIRGEVGGEDFERYILRLEPREDDALSPIVLLPSIEDNTSMSLDDMCKLSVDDDDSGTTPVDANGRLFQFRYNPAYPLGLYTLRGYVCVGGSVAELEDASQTSVNVELAAPENRTRWAEFAALGSALQGDAILRGVARSPIFQQYFVQIVRAEDAPQLTTQTTEDDAEVPWITIEPRPEFDPLVQPDCSQEVDNSSLGSHQNLNEGIVAHLNTMDYQNGSYYARLMMCQDGEEPLDDLIKFAIENPNAVSLVSPGKDDVTTGVLRLIGTVLGTDLQQYTVEIEPVDEDPATTWTTIVGPLYDGTDRSNVDLCTLPAPVEEEFGLQVILSPRLLAPPVDTSIYANGLWNLRIRSCVDDAVAAQQVVLLTINNTGLPPAQLEITNIEPDSPPTVSNQLPIRGSAFGQDFAGYVVEIAPEWSRESRTILFPESLAGITENGDADVCETQDLPDNTPAISNGVMYTLDAADYPIGNYELTFTLCINSPTPRMHSQEKREVSLEGGDLEVSFGEPLLPTTGDDLVNIVGTIFAPEDQFSRYYMELAPQSSPDDWRVIVGQSAEGDVSCSTSPLEGTLGAYPVIDGTLAIFGTSVFGIENDNYDLRLTICFSDGTDFQQTYSTVFPASSVARLVPEGALGVETGTLRAVSLFNETLSLRTGPSFSYPGITMIPQNASVDLVGRSQDSRWLYVDTDSNGSGDGWVELSRVYITASNADVLEALQVIQTPPLPGSGNSPLRPYIFYASDDTGLWQIYRADGNGRGSVLLTTDGNNEFPSVSPDGRRVAFASDRDGNREIYLMNIDGSGQIDLTNNGASDYRPEWSPDGSYLLFESDRIDGLRNLFALDVTTGAISQVTHGLGSVCCVTWAPSGNRVAFAANGTGNYDIYIYDVDTGNAVNITNNPADDVNPVWQPQGNSVAFQSKQAGNWNIYRTNADGTGTEQLTRDSGDNIEPRWLNRNELIFSTNREQGDYALYIMDSNGTDQRRVINSPGADGQPE